MKAIVVLGCLLAAVSAGPVYPVYSYFASPYGLHTPLVYSPIAPLVHYPESGAVVPADAPDVAAAKVAHFAAHAEALSRSKRSTYYPGPPAPLNPDGTVAQTPEVAAAAAYQQAAHAHEARRLADAAALAAAHPDTTSPSESWNSAPSYNPAPAPQPQQQYWAGRSYNGAPIQPAPLNPDGTVAQTQEYQAIAASHAAAHHYGRRRRSAPLNPDGTVAPTPEVAAATAEHLAAKARAVGYHATPLAVSPYSIWSPSLHYFAAPSYYSWSPAAPLNHDGTVAHTPEYLAVAASHAAAHHEALARSKRSVSLNPDGTVAPTPEVAAATASHLAALAAARGVPLVTPYYASPYYASPYYWTAGAPLHADGRVAETPEVAAASAAHHGAVFQQLQLLAAQDALAAAAGGDETAHFYPAIAYSAVHAAAPLNPDGTVAHTPEYKAIAASHAAAHHA